MRVILDTCVLSELQRSRGSAVVRARVDQLDPNETYLSVITIGEFVKGIKLLVHGVQRRRLEDWLLGLERQYRDHLLGIDSEITYLWGETTARAQRDGITIPTTDGLIAATALRHGLHLMTRNTKHFSATGVPIIDPWEAS